MSTQTGNPSWDNSASASIQGSGNDRHVELWQQWLDHYAMITYNDYNATPSNQSWKISADLQGTYLGIQHRIDAIQLKDNNGNTVFSLGFNCNNVFWNYFDETDHYLVQSNTICSSGLSYPNAQNFAIGYNPTSGEIVIYRNGASIFTTIVNMNILISKVTFINRTDANTWDPGTFYVDNVKTSIEQNRDIRFRGIATSSLDYDILNKIKSKFGANQVRYFIAPMYAANNPYNPVSNPFGGTLNSFLYWNDAISKLSSSLENARKLGLAVVINVHQTPSADYSHQPPAVWDEGQIDPIVQMNEKQKFLFCWRQITQQTKNRNQVLWLELYNEPNVQPSNPDAEQTLWNKLAQTAIDEIRGQNNINQSNNNYNHAFEDHKHPIVFYSGPGALDWGFRFAPLMNDTYMPVIYSLHQWKEENCYTHWGLDGHFDTTCSLVAHRPLKFQIRDLIKYSKQFQDFYGVKMWVGEYGVNNNPLIPEKDIWVKDHIDLFEEYGWNWGFWAWDSPWSPEDDNSTINTTSFTPVGDILHRGLQLNY